MNRNYFRGVLETSDIIPPKYNADWFDWTKWWNEHDSGVRSLTNISFGTACLQVSSAYTATAQDQVILVDSTSGTVAVTLPTSIGINGRRYTVKDWKGQSATHNITVGTTSSQKIDGASTKVLALAYESYTFVSDGANWSII